MCVFAYRHINTHTHTDIHKHICTYKPVIFIYLFAIDKPGHYEVSLPIVLNDDYETPYQYISLSGELKCPHVWFDPLAIVLTPVPLDMEISADFLIMATDYMM